MLTAMVVPQSRGLRLLVLVLCGMGWMPAPRSLAAAPAVTTSQAVTAPGIGFFVSIDGLQPEQLKAMLQQGQLRSERGLAWLLHDAQVSWQASPIVTAITAASHISTVTCTPPSRHGIVANNYLKDGAKVSGFSERFTTEPLWRSAMRQGKSVLSLAYVGSDGSSEERQATYGLAYPDERVMGAWQTQTLAIASLPKAEGWELPDDFARTADLRQAKLEVVINPTTGEKQTLHLLLALGTEVTPRLYAGFHRSWRDRLPPVLRPGEMGTASIDAFTTENHTSSPLHGSKRRVTLYGSMVAPGQLQIYLTRASYNLAYPASFRQQLDDLDLVWPDYGVRDPSLKLSDGQWLAAQRQIDDFLAQVARVFVPKLNPDLVLFYQPLIDALGHRSQALLPQRFSPANQDEVTRAFVKAFQVVDENLNQVLGSAQHAPRGLGPVVVMGDHGMDAIRHVVNAAKFLPADHTSYLDVTSSGDLLLIYPQAGAKPALWQAAVASLKTGLAAYRHEGRPVLGYAGIKSEFPVASSDPFKAWPYGQAVAAFAATAHYSLQYQPLKPDFVLPPSALGMHGKMVADADMRTAMIVKAPGLVPRDLGASSLLDAAPTLSKLLGIAPPRDCMGKSLVP